MRLVIRTDRSHIPKALSIQVRFDLLLKVPKVVRIRENLTGNGQIDSGDPCRLECPVTPLFRADPAKEQSETTGMGDGGKEMLGNAIFDIGQQCRVGCTGAMLGFGYAIVKGPRPAARYAAWWIPVDRQMKGHQYRQTRFGEVSVEVQAMHVYQIDAGLVQSGSNDPATIVVDPGTGGIVDGSGDCRQGMQDALRPGSCLCDDKGGMSLVHKCSVKHGKDLLRASGGIGSNR